MPFAPTISVTAGLVPVSASSTRRGKTISSVPDYLAFCASWSPGVKPGAVVSTILIPMPCDFDIQRVEISNSGSAGGASRPTVSCLTGTLGNDLFQDDTDPENPLSYITLIPGATVRVTMATLDGVTPIPYLVDAKRHVSQANVLAFGVTTVADEVVDCLTIIVSGTVRGFIPQTAADV